MILWVIVFLVLILWLAGWQVLGFPSIVHVLLLAVVILVIYELVVRGRRP